MFSSDIQDVWVCIFRNAKPALEVLCACRLEAFDQGEWEVVDHQVPGEFWCDIEVVQPHFAPTSQWTTIDLFEESVELCQYALASICVTQISGNQHAKEFE